MDKSTKTAKIWSALMAYMYPNQHIEPGTCGMTAQRTTTELTRCRLTSVLSDKVGEWLLNILYQWLQAEKGNKKLSSYRIVATMQLNNYA